MEDVLIVCNYITRTEITDFWLYRSSNLEFTCAVLLFFKVHLSLYQLLLLNVTRRMVESVGDIGLRMMRIMGYHLRHTITSCRVSCPNLFEWINGFLEALVSENVDLQPMVANPENFIKKYNTVSRKNRKLTLNC